VRAISSSLAEQDAAPGADASPGPASGVVAAFRVPGLSRWVQSHRNGVIDAAWMIFSLVNLDAILM
jgi:hypothetical protein